MVHSISLHFIKGGGGGGGGQEKNIIALYAWN